MSKEYVEGMRVRIPWEKGEVSPGTGAVVYELDENGEQIGTVLLTNEQYRRKMLPDENEDDELVHKTDGETGE